MPISFSSPLPPFSAASTPSFPGCLVQSDGRHLLCSGFTPRTTFFCYPSRLRSGLHPNVKIKSIAFNYSSVEAKFVCRATLSPDSPRHRRSGQSQNRNRQTEEEVEDFLDLEGNGMLHSKNGVVPSLTSQATVTSEQKREIVKLFRKIQDQIRGREGSKLQTEDRTSIADSVINVLREDTAKESNSSHDRGRGQNPMVKSNQVNEKHRIGQSLKFVDSDSFTKDEPEQTKLNSVRPPSKLQKKSSVPHVKYSPISPTFEKYTASSESPGNARGKSKNSLNRMTLKSDDDVDDVQGVFVNALTDTEPESELEEPGLKNKDMCRDETEQAKHNSVRPLSRFQKRSPVPRAKYQRIPFTGEKHTANGKAGKNMDRTTLKKDDVAVPAAYTNPMSDTEPGSELEEPGLKDKDAFLGEDNNNGRLRLDNLRALKLQELREMARSRGLKGISKTKKDELVVLLSNCAA